MKQFLKDNWFKLAIILVALFAIVLFFASRDSELSQIRSDKENQLYRLNQCLSASENSTERADCFKQFPQ